MVHANKKTHRFWIVGLIIVAYLNAILRLSPESSFTLFRVCLPFVFCFFAFKNINHTSKYVIFSIFLLLYSYVISYLPFNRFQNFDIIFTSHYILLPFCFLLVDFFVLLVGVDFLYLVFKRFHFIMLFLALLQFFVGGVYPNTQDRSPMVNIFFGNENEFSAVLAIFLPLFMIREKTSILKVVCVILTLFFIVYNDARLLMIGVVVFLYCYYTHISPLYRYDKGLWYGILGVLVVLVMALFSETTFFDGYTFVDLFVDPIVRIVSLNPYNEIGSLAVRVNAYIWGLIELRNSYFMGVGPGNTLTLMIEKAPRGMIDFTAKSFHNILLQMLVELGVVGALMIGAFIRWIREAIKRSSYSKSVTYGYYIATLIFSTILAGAFSNYAFIFILAFSYYFFLQGKKEKKGSH